jgi:hypothetical protein
VPRSVAPASPKVPPSEAPCSEAPANIKILLSEAPLSLALRSEASASSGAPFSETPTREGRFVVLPRAGGRGHRVLGRKEHSVHGRESSRRRQRGFDQQRGGAQRDENVARNAFMIVRFKKKQKNA